MNVIVEIDATWLISIYPSHDANHLEALAQKDACVKSGPQCGMNALPKHQELSGEKRQESKLTQTKYIIIETAGEKMIWCSGAQPEPVSFVTAAKKIPSSAFVIIPVTMAQS